MVSAASRGYVLCGDVDGVWASLRPWPLLFRMVAVVFKSFARGLKGEAMKRFAIWALMALMICILFAPLVVAQVDSTGTDTGQPDAKTIGLIWASCASVAAVVAGFLIKQAPWLPNETIPYLTAIFGVIGFMWLGDMSFKAATLLAMATAHGATMLAEGTKLLTKPRGGE